MILVLYAGGVLAFLWHSLSTELDRQLEEDFEIAEAMLGRTAEGRIRWRANENFKGKNHNTDDDWVEVWSPKGTLLYRNGSLKSRSGDPVSAAYPPHQYGHKSVTLSSDVHVRVLDGPYSIDGLPVVIRVARSETALRAELGELLLVLGVGLPLAVGIAGFGGYGLARRALAPVGRMADQARMITAERLSDRLPVVNPDDELGHLAKVFNETFARLEQSFAQLHRFTADAAHELRTPLTVLRSVGEVGLREHRAEDAYRELIGSMLEEGDRLGHLVESLLLLSRADVGQVKLTFERVDLAALACEVIAHMGVLAEEKGQFMTQESSRAVYATVDRFVLRQAVINLVDNAIKYSPEGGRILVVVQDHPLGSTLEVSDTGPGIEGEHQERIFDRFYRVDRARSREFGGTGLGLSIARWAVEANGGRLELARREGQGSLFRITLPRTDPPKSIEASTSREGTSPPNRKEVTSQRV